MNYKLSAKNLVSRKDALLLIATIICCSISHLTNNSANILTLYGFLRTALNRAVTVG